MANLLALDWDGREARVAVARRRGADIVLEQAFAVPLGAGGADETFSEAEVGQRLAAAFSARQIGRCDSLVAVGRSRIELRSLALPPSPIEELPELVRFQALRQFAAIGEDWPLDFVHLNTGEEETFTVLAAAISPELVQDIRAACGTAGQSPRHLVLRPFAAASLLLRNMRDEACRLMVDLLADEADLTVVADRQLVFVRTVRLPETDDAERKHRSLLVEIRRTMVAAQNQLGGRAVERIVLCGGQEEHADLQARTTEALSLPVDIFDPLTAVELGSRLEGELPAKVGRFAPLLGMLLDEASGSAHAIDFLHPRKKPQPKSRKRTAAMLGAGLAAILLLGAGLAYAKYSAMGAEAAALKKKAQQLTKTEEIANQAIAEAQVLDAWNSGDIVWLDELRNLSENYPPAEEAVITLFAATGGQREGGGRYYIDCAAVEHQAIAEIERLLRDQRHEVLGSGGSTEETEAGYRWVFQKMVSIAPPTEEPAAEEPAADESPADQSSADQSSSAAAGPSAAAEAAARPLERGQHDQSTTARIDGVAGGRS